MCGVCVNPGPGVAFIAIPFSPPLCAPTVLPRVASSQPPCRPCQSAARPPPRTESGVRATEQWFLRSAAGTAAPMRARSEAGLPAGPVDTHSCTRPRTPSDLHLVFADGHTLCRMFERLCPGTRLCRFHRAVTRATALVPSRPAARVEPPAAGARDAACYSKSSTARRAAAAPLRRPAIHDLRRAAGQGGPLRGAMARRPDRTHQLHLPTARQGAARCARERAPLVHAARDHAARVAAGEPVCGTAGRCVLAAGDRSRAPALGACRAHHSRARASRACTADELLHAASRSRRRSGRHFADVPRGAAAPIFPLRGGPGTAPHSGGGVPRSAGGLDDARRVVARGRVLGKGGALGPVAVWRAEWRRGAEAAAVCDARPHSSFHRIAVQGPTAGCFRSRTRAGTGTSSPASRAPAWRRPARRSSTVLSRGPQYTMAAPRA